MRGKGDSGEGKEILERERRFWRGRVRESCLLLKNCDCIIQESFYAEKAYNPVEIGAWMNGRNEGVETGGIRKRLAQFGRVDFPIWKTNICSHVKSKMAL